MATSKVVVLGGSAGSIEALRTIVAGLPTDLPLALVVVVHLPPRSRSQLPEILSRLGTLPAEHAQPNTTIRPGRIYVAPPDHHLLVRNGHLDIGRGPRENHTRPSIDPLFRSASKAYGANLLAVLLSGAQSDGTLGLMAVKARGGRVIVQDPAEALVTSMPTHAIEAGLSDRVLPADQIASEIVAFAAAPTAAEGVPQMVSEVEQAPNIIVQNMVEQTNGARHGMPSIYSCPDCGGVLWQVNEGQLIHFYCHVGHSFSPDVLLDQRTEELENALWTAVRALREKSLLQRQLANNARAAGNEELAQRLEEEVTSDKNSIDLILNELLGSGETPMIEKQKKANL